MSQIEIRDALRLVRDAVPVPPPDPTAVRNQARRHRRRRATLQGLTATAAIAAVAATGVLARAVVAGNNDPAPSTKVVDIEPALPFPFVVDNRLALALPDGTTVITTLGVQEVLGQTRDGVVVNGNDSLLSWVVIEPDGDTGSLRQLAPGPVKGAALSQDGATIAYIDLDDTLHLRRVEAGTSTPDLVTAEVPRHSTVIDTDGDTWLLYDFRTEALTAHRYVDGTEISIPIEVSDGMLSVAELAGSTVAVPTLDGGAATLDATTGALEDAHVADAAGALSPDGNAYVTGNLQPGQAPRLVDLTGGDSTALRGLRSDQSVWRVVWQGNTRFYIAGVGESARTLWACTIAARCERLTDLGDGAVELPYG